MTHEESIRLARHEAEVIDRLIEDHGSEWLDNTGIGLRGWWTPDKDTPATPPSSPHNAPNTIESTLTP